MAKCWQHRRWWFSGLSWRRWTCHDFRLPRESTTSSIGKHVSRRGWSSNKQFKSHWHVGNRCSGHGGRSLQAHQELGSLPWEDLVAPAVALARDGIPINYSLQIGFARSANRFRQYPSSAEKFFRADGSLYELGDTWLQPDLSHTLELIQNNGRDGFYKGENAKKLADFMAANGGMITCLLYTSPSPRDKRQSRMPSSA